MESIGHCPSLNRNFRQQCGPSLIIVSNAHGTCLVSCFHCLSLSRPDIRDSRCPVSKCLVAHAWYVAVVLLDSNAIKYFRPNRQSICVIWSGLQWDADLSFGISSFLTTAPDNWQNSPTWQTNFSTESCHRTLVCVRKKPFFCCPKSLAYGQLK